jgi:hypothetical protein
MGIGYVTAADPGPVVRQDQINSLLGRFDSVPEARLVLSLFNYFNDNVDNDDHSNNT